MLRLFFITKFSDVRGPAVKVGSYEVKSILVGFSSVRLLLIVKFSELSSYSFRLVLKMYCC